MNTKKFFQIIAVSATALLTACEERLTSYDSETPITVTTQVSEKTRAGYDNSNLPSTFVMDIYQGGGSYDYSLVEMTREENSNTYSAPSDVLLLWKGTDHSGASIKAMTIPNATIDPTNTMTVKVANDQTTDANVKASDLLGAKSGDGITIDGDNINIEFRHLMSKLHVIYTFADASNTARVNSIKLKNTCVQGGYSYANMDYDESIESIFGEISMRHNSDSKTTEAIFFPHSPHEKLSLEVNVTINNQTKTLSCPIDLRNGKTFEGGKIYTMNIKINGGRIDNAYITTVKDWISDSGSMTNKKILWVGTSIPAGAVGNNYPEMITAATGYEIRNSSVPGSSIGITYNNTWSPGWQTSADVTNVNYYVHTLNLGATPEEMKAQWYDQLDEIRRKENLPQEILDAWMDFIYSHSYVNMIIPYIDGTKGNYNVLVIDHGFNDRMYIAMECYGHKLESESVPGLTWLEQLEDKTQYVPFENLRSSSYFVCMNRMIEACMEANPNLKIIIGNYFAQSAPIFDNPLYGMADNGGAAAAKLIVKANEAVAKMNGLDIVNVYKYTGLDDASSHDLYNTLVPVDGVHPVNDPLGRLNRIIANIYLEEFRRIFGEE